jgi:peptidoglycan/LPS O-acetylase OafA/YrhL
VVLAKAFEFWPQAARFSTQLYLGAGAGLLGAFILLGDTLPHHMVHNGLLSPLFAALLIGLAWGGGGMARWLASPPLQFLGNASYAMYILHIPVYVYLSILFRRVLHAEDGGLVWIAVYLLAVIAVASLFYAVVEEPLHRWLRKKLEALVTA